MSASPQAAGTPSAATPTPGAKADNPQYCAHNADPACPRGSYLGPFVSVLPSGGHWDAAGRPVNGGPAGADGSTGNNLTHEYCARNQDPACPVGSYVAPNAIPNPDGTSSYVVCEGTICTNPNHGAGDPPGGPLDDGTGVEPGDDTPPPGDDNSPAEGAPAADDGGADQEAPPADQDSP
jgi:hypothetical protein